MHLLGLFCMLGWGQAICLLSLPACWGGPQEWGREGWGSGRGVSKGVKLQHLRVKEALRAKEQKDVWCVFNQLMASLRTG